MVANLTDAIRQANILIVDDNEANVFLLESMLRQAGYESIEFYTDPRLVEDAYRQTHFDLILLDLRMPHIDGFELYSRLSKIAPDDYLPVLVLTAQNDRETRIRALEMGAKDFLTKPIEQTEVLHRVRNMLEVRLLYNERMRQAEILEEQVRERTRDIEDTQVEILRRLGRASKFRDNETGNHIVRVSLSCQRLALAAGHGETMAELLYRASPMHDVGKIGIPDQILLKAGPLTPQEWEVMKMHAEIGAEILAEHPSEIMQVARTIAITHHEKWDGSGYPNGLSGADIPIEGRICAIADVFDALTSERPYKRPWPLEEAVEEIKKGAGAHFDPDLVEHFLGIIDDVVEIRREYPDDPEEFAWQQKVMDITESSSAA